MPDNQPLNWELIDKVTSGTATPAEQKAWEAYISLHPQLPALIPWLQRVKQNQDQTTSPFYALDSWQQFKTARLQPQKHQAAPSRNLVVMLRRTAVAAAIIMLIGMGWWMYKATTDAPPSPALTSYQVPYGKNKLITLPDQSQIWVNAGSTLSVPEHWEASQLREIWLEGEAFFEVTKNPERPFVVHTRETSIRVLGTSFNIEAYRQDAVAVTVNTGRVQFTGNREAVVLTPGNRAIWIKDSAHIQTQSIDAAVYNSWRSGLLQFRDEPLQQVFARLERRFNVQIKTENVLIRDRYCTATFTATESLDNILESLRNIYGLNITRKGSNIIIHKNK